MTPLPCRYLRFATCDSAVTAAMVAVESLAVVMVSNVRRVKGRRE
jgi:hypothetical protein